MTEITRFEGCWLYRRLYQLNIHFEKIFSPVLKTKTNGEIKIPIKKSITTIEEQISIKTLEEVLLQTC